MKIDYYATTDIGKVRSQNEDAVLSIETPNGVLCAVCDGMGGHPDGDIAANMAIEALKNYHLGKKFDKPGGEELAKAMLQANDEIIEANQQEEKFMGTTAVALLVQSKLAWYAHVGDSRLYLLRGGVIQRLTTDHSLVGKLHAEGVLTEDEANSHPKKGMLLQCLGNEKARPDFSRDPIELENGDAFLLCSDGLSGLISDDELEETYSQSQLQEEPLELLAATLVEKANERGGLDNISVSLAKISKLGFKSKMQLF